MSDRALARVATGMFVVAAALFAVAIGFSRVNGWLGDPWWPIVLAAWAVTGLVLAVRVPRNATGWLFLVSILAWGANSAAGQYATYGLVTSPGSLPGAVWGFWLQSWTWIVGLMLVPAIGLLLFPNGRLPSPRWRFVAWASATGMGLLWVAYVFAPWQGHPEFVTLPPGVENPLLLSFSAQLHDALALAGAALVLGSVIAGAVSLIVRYRRARGDERQQLKWVAFGTTAAVALHAAVNELPAHVPGVDWWVLLALPWILFPATILVAVLRYRLYEIDRVVSRAVSYAVITGVLVICYAVAVVLLGQVISPLTAESEVAVAASTLLVAALFQPVRRRVQDLVDRRFNRARYDARRTVEDFAARLRDEVDLDELTSELGGLVGATVQPASVSVWLRRPGQVLPTQPARTGGAPR
jgi:hypothetical protein